MSHKNLHFKMWRKFLHSLLFLRAWKFICKKPQKISDSTHEWVSFFILFLRRDFNLSKKHFTTKHNGGKKFSKRLHLFTKYMKNEKRNALVFYRYTTSYSLVLVLMLLLNIKKCKIYETGERSRRENLPFFGVIGKWKKLSLKRLAFSLIFIRYFLLLSQFSPLVVTDKHIIEEYIITNHTWIFLCFIFI